MDTKRRRKFFLYNEYNYPKAWGILYDEGNVQIMWRSDKGHVAEQYHNIWLVLDLRDDITQLKFVE